jgi:hypothetical protein
MMDVVNPHHAALSMSDDLLVSSIEASNAPAANETTPAVVRASLIAPYLDGILFVHALRRRGMARGSDPTGWGEVDRAWRSPPETTEQLLHIEKYDAREPAELLGPLPPPSETDWSAIYEDVFGEQGLRISVEQWMPRKVAALVAAGWGGDRLALFRRGAPAPSGEPVATPSEPVPPATYAVAWHIRFDAGRPDTDVEARQAFKALVDALHARKDTASNTACVERGALGPFAIVRAGRDLALATGPYDHVGGHVRSSAVCAQTVRWASDILRKGKS